MVEYLHQQDWQDFEKKFPPAAAFLRERSLHNELTYLENIAHRSRWQEDRLAELAGFLSGRATQRRTRTGDMK